MTLPLPRNAAKLRAASFFKLRIHATSVAFPTTGSASRPVRNRQSGVRKRKIHGNACANAHALRVTFLRALVDDRGPRCGPHLDVSVLARSRRGEAPDEPGA